MLVDFSSVFSVKVFFTSYQALMCVNLDHHEYKNSIFYKIRIHGSTFVKFFTKYPCNLIGKCVKFQLVSSILLKINQINIQKLKLL